MKLLQDKVCLITGGSRGIGESLVRRFAEEGATVAFTYISSSERAQKIEDELNAAGGNVKAFQSDASSFEASADLTTAVLEHFSRIDVLVNNAGITRDTLLLRMSETQWDEVLTTNLKSIFNLTKHVLRPMLKQRKGSIINVSSVVGIMGNAGQANYAASKAGIMGFSKSVAKELGMRNIRCNILAPGFIETEMTDAISEDKQKEFFANIPMRRFGKSEEIANAALFLASDLSSYVSGQTLSVCGGLSY